MSASERRGALAALAMCMLLPSLGTSIANVALPTLVDAFGVSVQHVKWVVLSYLFAVTVMVVVSGVVADRFGQRRVLVAGILLFAVASMLCGMAPSFAFLVGARTLQGVGAAAMMSIALALAADARGGDTARTVGILGTTSAIGTALGPTLGGLLIASFGWRAIFLVKVPLALAALGLAMREEHRIRDGRRSPRVTESHLTRTRSNAWSGCENDVGWIRKSG